MKNWLILIGTLFAAVVTIFVFASRMSHRHMQSIQCGDSMIGIGYAARLWAAEHQDRLPPDFRSMAAELRSPQLLICPGDDTGRQPALTWASLTPGHSSYEMVNGNLSVTNGRTLYIRCQVHGYSLMANGTVFDGARKITR
jgi:hypothetical protein